MHGILTYPERQNRISRILPVCPNSKRRLYKQEGLQRVNLQIANFLSSVMSVKDAKHSPYWLCEWLR